MREHTHVDHFTTPSENTTCIGIHKATMPTNKKTGWYAPPLPVNQSEYRIVDHMIVWWQKTSHLPQQTAGFSPLSLTYTPTLQQVLPKYVTASHLLQHSYDPSHGSLHTNILDLPNTPPHDKYRLMSRLVTYYSIPKILRTHRRPRSSILFLSTWQIPNYVTCKILHTRVSPPIIERFQKCSKLPQDGARTSS